jgi:hypothetical protein
MSSFQKGWTPGQQSLGQPMICAAIARGKKYSGHTLTGMNRQAVVKHPVIVGCSHPGTYAYLSRVRRSLAVLAASDCG